MSQEQQKKQKQKQKNKTFLLPDYAFFNCGLISPIFGHFLK